MGPHASPRNSTCLPTAASGVRSQDGAGRPAQAGGRIFRGETPRPLLYRSGARLQGVRPFGVGAYRLPALGPAEERGMPAAREALRSVRPFDWEGLSSVPSDRERTRSGVHLAGLEGLWLLGRHLIRPVLKHGPRSLTCARVTGLYEI